MDPLFQISALLPRTLCKDRYAIQRALAAFKKKAGPKKPLPPKNLEKALSLLARAQASADTWQQRQQRLPDSIRFDPQLPINRRKQDIIQAIQDHPVVIISGETGSGKTTQIPKFCLEAGRGLSGVIGCTQPRRIAAVTVAKRIAHELNQPMGESVGYKIRFDDKTPPLAHIKLMTDGILLAETQQDRFLNLYDTLIVDEAHERSLNIDFTLGILRRLLTVRKDLKLIITSATIDTEKFSKAFNNAPVIEVSGRMFPVETLYMPPEAEPGDGSASGMEDQGYVEAAAAAVIRLLNQSGPGDILVFMPTEQDIGETMELIRAKDTPGVTVLPLFARLSAGEQAKVFSQGPGRKVVVATNVAETSLTIPGIKYVVDTGLARIPSYSPRTRTTSLPVSPISQSAANQRKGRCGRVENGVCIRLYEETDFQSRPYFTAPEILRSNLAEVILRMIFLNLGEVATFPFIDPPSAKSIKDGFDTLVELSAIRKKPTTDKKSGKGAKGFTLTRTGRIMARLPLDPKLSRILIQAKEYGCLDEAVIIVTALSVSDIRQRPSEKAQAADQRHQVFKDPSSDFITLLNIWKACRQAARQQKSRSGLRKWCVSHYLSFKRLREWQDIHRQVSRMLKDHGIHQKGVPKPKEAPEKAKDLKSKEFSLGGPLYIAIHQSLLHGYLSGIALKKEKNTYTAAKGQQVVIFPGSGLFDKAGTWIMAAEFVKTSQLFARGVANIDPDWLEIIGKDLCTRTYSDPHWEKKQGKVVAKEQVSLYGLVIARDKPVAYGNIHPDEAFDIFIRAALIDEEIIRPFGFMAHNRKLIQDLETLEHKTRKKGILASEDEIFEFYKKRLPQPFFDIRTFSRFLKENGSDDFLCMTREDLQKNEVAASELSQFPDSLQTDQGNFALAYEFNPGADTDGVTLKVPARQADQVSRNRVDRLVPGLFEEKIAALLKNLPKKYRVRLVPVHEKASWIARALTGKEKNPDTPLFTALSTLIREKYQMTIPATVWSEENLPDHLKMRISIQDEKGRELKALRDLSILNQFPADTSHDIKKDRQNAFELACKTHEKFDIQDWSFPDLPEPIPLNQTCGSLPNAYPGLKVDPETNQLNLRLFTSPKEALNHHLKGVGRLFELVYPDHFTALKKDIRKAGGIRQIAPYFNGAASMEKAIYNLILKTFFETDTRTKEAFMHHGEEQIPRLYAGGQAAIKAVMDTGREYEACFSLIQKLSLQYKERQAAFSILTRLFNALKNLIPPHFLELYTLDRIRSLPRYIACLKIRSQRAVDNPVKEAQKAQLIQPFETRFDTLLSTLTEKSSPEKANAAEAFYWLMEEYKISVFAQELKTREKVSAKRLNKALADLSLMI